MTRQSKKYLFVGFLCLLGMLVLGILPLRMIRKNANYEQVVEGFRALHQATHLYYDRNAELPLSEDKTQDTTITTDASKNGFIYSLYPHDLPKDNNYHLYSLDFRMAEKGKSGLLKSPHGYDFVDPWGQPYWIRLDYDYDGSITDEATGVSHSSENFLIWSIGPDGKNGTADDITNWIR